MLEVKINGNKGIFQLASSGTIDEIGADICTVIHMIYDKIDSDVIKQRFEDMIKFNVEKRKCFMSVEELKAETESLENELEEKLEELQDMLKDKLKQVPEGDDENETVGEPN